MAQGEDRPASSPGWVGGGGGGGGGGEEREREGV